MHARQMLPAAEPANLRGDLLLPISGRGTYFSNGFCSIVGLVPPATALAGFHVAERALLVLTRLRQLLADARSWLFT